MKRIHQLGMFHGWQEEDPDQLDIPFPRGFAPVDREQPAQLDPTYDPLQDHLDEPFPEEME
ncbi:MAG TPA: hypothetical protein VI700_01310 [Thermoanaerobaculaceae bacterium]|nr:hypothetical protein [Thermoanaerobaculaceae bacterium]